MTGPSLFASYRDDIARREAIRVYDEAETTHRSFAEAHAKTNAPLNARREAQRAWIAHRAAVAEHTDPDPLDRGTAMCCSWSLVYRQLPESVKAAQE